MRAQTISASSTSPAVAAPKVVPSAAASEDLAHHGQVGQDAGELLGAARGDAEPGDDLVEDQQRVIARAEVAQELEEPRRGRDHAHIGRVGLGEDRRRLVLGDGSADRLGIVPGDDDRGGGRGCGHPGAGGDPLRRQARAAVGEQAIHVPVVGAGELQDLLAPRCRARQADRAHRRLGARRRHPDHLHRRHASHDLLGEIDLRGGRRAERRPLRGRVGHRGQHLGVGVAVDQRPPRAHPVDVRVAVDIDDLRVVRVLDEQRVAPDRAHGPHRRVHASGQDL